VAPSTQRVALGKTQEKHKPVPILYARHAVKFLGHQAEKKLELSSKCAPPVFRLCCERAGVLKAGCRVRPARTRLCAIESERRQRARRRRSGGVCRRTVQAEKKARMWGANLANQPDIALTEGSRVGRGADSTQRSRRSGSWSSSTSRRFARSWRASCTTRTPSGCRWKS
jgi:hypothetical protein